MDLERLLDAWRSPLAGLLAAWGSPWPEARELAEEVFVQAWLGRARFRGALDDEARVGAWLRGIAHKLWLAAQRERARSPGAGAEALARATQATAEPNEPDDSDERLAALRAALDTLEPELREALYVRYVEGCALATVAGLLGISVRAAEGRLYRGRQELKERIERETKRPRQPEVQR
jgi:RNA polymerase sigma-70 factor (ECF subfamily)